LEHLAGSAPQQRPEVIQVFETFCAAVGQPNRRMRRPGFECLDANHIAEALATYGLEQCLLVANHAPNDGRVNGTTDERREKHDTVRYVFGNPDTFARILHAAQGAAAQPGRRNANRSMAEVMAEARAGGVR